jgi:hypothetical protein
LGGAVVSVRPEAQYLEFSFAASIQGWRTKWFYIKDRKASPEDQYGLPLQHRLTKLWSYSGLEDPTRVSEDLIEKKDVDN